MQPLKERGLEQELIFQASRSGGAGGQHVNKVATKVEVKFHVDSSQVLQEDEKAMVHEKLAGRINGEGFLQVVCQTERTQLRNKQLCVEKFYDLLRQAFIRKKKRTATKPTRASVKKRLDAKKKTSEKKANRNYFRDS